MSTIANPDPVMPPFIVAGSRPAAARLAQRPPSDRDTSVALHRLLPAMLTQTGRPAVSVPSTAWLDPTRSPSIAPRAAAKSP